jgi:hypothetical protein
VSARDLAVDDGTCCSSTSPYVFPDGYRVVFSCTLPADHTDDHFAGGSAPRGEEHTWPNLPPVQPRTFGYNVVTVAPDGTHGGTRLDGAVTRERAQAEIDELAPFMIDGYTTVLVELREVTL